MRAVTGTLLILLAFAAAPAAALAQSAGDEQYVDPFQNSPGGEQGNGESTGGDQTQSESAPTAQAEPAQQTGTGSQSTAPDSDATLPRTGLPLGWLATTGTLLLAGGFTLRRRA